MAKDLKETPEWTKKDLEICKQSDEKVKNGKMTYRSIKIN